jgi:hypothetical protein
VLNEDGTLSHDSTTKHRQLFPAYLNNQSYLVAREKGETLRTSPVIPAGQNMMVITTDAEVTPPGALRASTRLSFDGYNDNAYRGYFSQITPEERRKFFERMVMRTAPGGVVKSFELLPADMLDTSQHLEARIGFEVKSWIIRGKDTFSLPGLFFGRSVGMANILIGRMGLKKRKYPYVTDVACGISETVSIRLADSDLEPVSLPVYGAIDNSGVSWKTTGELGPGRYTVEHDFRMKIPEYSPEEYLELQENLKEIERHNRKCRSLPPATKAASSEGGMARGLRARRRGPGRDPRVRGEGRILMDRGPAREDEGAHLFGQEGLQRSSDKL